LRQNGGHDGIPLQGMYLEAAFFERGRRWAQSIDDRDTLATLLWIACVQRCPNACKESLLKMWCWRDPWKSWKILEVECLKLSEFWMYLLHATAPMLCTWFPIHPPCNRMLENGWPNASCNGAGAMAAGFLEWSLDVRGCLY
jgi:hypothetical protein